MTNSTRNGRVLVAPSAFGGTLTAGEAAAAMAAGVLDAGERTRTTMTPSLLPVSDGGPGLVSLAVSAGFDPQLRTVSGPLGQRLEAAYAVGTLNGKRTAVVELAQASGLHLLGRPPGPDTAMLATTKGTGDLLLAALDEGVQTIVLGLGGSASTDGGVGLLGAIGVRFLDADGQQLQPEGDALDTVAGIDATLLDPRLDDVELVVAADVDSPLVGPKGAAQVFGPQKGAGRAEIARLDARLQRLADVIYLRWGRDVATVPGGGAAGGTAAGVLGVLGARLVPGIDVALDLAGFDSALAGADVVLTGEGRLDEQSLAGKAPVGVLRRAASAGVPVLVVAGQVTLSDIARARLRREGCTAVRALTDLEPDARRAMRDAAALVRRATADLLASWRTEQLRKEASP